MAAPGQRLVAHAQPACTGALGDLAKVTHKRFAVAQCVALNVAAEQHQVDAQLVHQVELALGAIEIALHARPRAALEITERLEQRDGNAQVLAQAADVLRAAGVIEQVVLEQLDAIKSSRRGGLQLLRQGAAQRHGGDRAFHAVTPVTG